MVQLISANKRNRMVCKLQPFLLECQVTSLLKKRFLFLGKSYKPKMTKKKERKKKKKRTTKIPPSGRNHECQTSTGINSLVHRKKKNFFDRSQILIYQQHTLNGGVKYDDCHPSYVPYTTHIKKNSTQY